MERNHLLFVIYLIHHVTHTSSSTSHTHTHTHKHFFQKLYKNEKFESCFYPTGPRSFCAHVTQVRIECYTASC